MMSRTATTIHSGGGGTHSTSTRSTAGLLALLMGSAALVGTGAINLHQAPEAHAAATIPTVDCSTDKSFINTGWNGSKVLGDNTDDDNWEVSYNTDPTKGYGWPNGTGSTIALPPSNATWHPAKVGKMSSGWVASPYKNANWISAQFTPIDEGYTNNQAVPAGQDESRADWYYRYQFNLDPAVDPGVVDLSATWFADNSVAGLWVNGHQEITGSTDYASTNYEKGNGTSAHLNKDWKSGLNTIIVQVKSNAITHGAEGFDAQAEPGSLCTTGFQVSKTVKGTDAHGNASPGTKLTYDIVVKNTGQADYTADDPASFTDDLSKVLDDATYNKDVSNGAIVDGNKLSWKGALKRGETKHITYSVTVNTPDKGDMKLDNAVVPGTGGHCTTSADCTTDVPVGGFTVAKTSAEIIKSDGSSASASPTPTPSASPSSATSTSTHRLVAGDAIKYTVTVTNTGKTDYTADWPATFTDDLSKVLDDATYNKDATGGATVSGTTLSWKGALAQGETKVITYSVTVNKPEKGNYSADNTVTPGKGGSCATGKVCATSNPIHAYTVRKSSDKKTVKAGDVIKYTLTVKNTGKGDYTADWPATFTDDLSKVLDDATYNKDATGGATVSGTTLSWKGALAQGETKVITYSVTVNKPEKGDKRLTNVVTPTGPGGSCDTVCTTTATVPPTPAAFPSTPSATLTPGAGINAGDPTGHDGWGPMAGLGAGVIALGLGAAGYGIYRRRHDA